jgi:3-methyladenine DNA glycosylase/8-oxoguanine DNA glycosylase
MVPPPDTAGGGGGWARLGTPSEELRLEFTLPTGQTFRWRRTGDAPLEYTGVIGQRLVVMRQLAGDVAYRVAARGPGAPAAGDDAAVRDYFNLATPLAPLRARWAAADARFAALTPHLPGARMLRQPPLECLFSFICSSNNHISRIGGMVERLAAYGTPLAPAAGAGAASGGPSPAAKAPPAAAAAKPSPGGGKTPPGGGKASPGGAAGSAGFFAFPTLEQLAAASEAQLRDAGFGYRAKYITGSVAALRARKEGEAWLLGLRAAPFEEASEALCELPGIGPKVAACVCLFSLDKHAAVPVDVHVWNLAVRDYLPHLAGRALTKPLHAVVAQAFVDRFGEHAGWRVRRARAPLTALARPLTALALACRNAAAGHPWRRPLPMPAACPRQSSCAANRNQKKHIKMQGAQHAVHRGAGQPPAPSA